MATRFGILIALLALIALTGCAGDDDPTAPGEAFSVDIVVVDAQGRPIPGLKASLSPDIPGVIWPLGAAANVAPAIAMVDLPDPVLVTLDVFAVDGRRVRHETREGIVALPTIVWDGRDDEGRLLHDGWYEGRLATAPDAETPPQEVLRRGLLLIHGTPEHHAAGITDRSGRINVTDRTYVPAFWDVDPIPILNAYGEVIETIEITRRTRIVLLAADGSAMSQVFEAVDGPQTVPIVWEPDQ